MSVKWALYFFLLLSTCSFGQEILSKDGYEFEFLQKVACNPVEDQASTGTCWSFSTGSFLESETIRLGGKAVNLSEMFFVRCSYLDKARTYLRYQGTSNFGEGGLSHDVLRILEEFGAMPESAYSGLTGETTRHNHGRLKREIHKYLDDLISTRTIPADWEHGLQKILDEHLGVLPASFEYEGANYDPKTFAEGYLKVDPDQYITLTSFSHHSLYSTFILEIPDNYAKGWYFNVSLDDLTEVCDRALTMGQSVVWDCDVSENGFSARQGLAIVPDEDAIQTSKQAVFEKPSPELNITAAMRQEEFDNYSLTDDHLMHIVGLAKDQNGKKYYYVKNSWGAGAGLNGYLFASEPYFQLNTIAILVHLDALPDRLLQKWQQSKSLSSTE